MAPLKPRLNASKFIADAWVTLKPEMFKCASKPRPI
jgi:hypothetical protein